MAIKYLLSSFLFCLICSGCISDPEPEAGYTKSFYFDMELGGRRFLAEANNPELQVGWGQSGIGSQAGFMFTNVFKGPGDEEYFIRLRYDGEIEEDDILDLKNKNVPINAGFGFPWVQIFIQDKSGNLKEYTTGVEELDYGSSVFIIHDVIKGPKVNFNHPIRSGEFCGRSYILRGECTFKMSGASGFNGQFYDVEKGRFSIRVIAP